VLIPHNVKGLGVVGIIEKREPTTEAYYFLKVENMN
jgi:hypothetical protein